MRQLDTRILLTHKTELSKSIGSSKDGQRHYHVHGSKSEREKYHQISPTGGIYQFIPMNDYRKQKKTYIIKKVNTKECSNYHTIALISHFCKVMLKILQLTLQQDVN